MADTDHVDDIPDVSLMGDDIPATTEDTPSESDQEAALGTDTQDEQPKEGEETSEGEQQPDSEEEQKTETDDEAAIRARNEEYARRRIQERQRTRQAVQQQIDQTYGPKTEEQLVDEGYDPRDAQIEALRQEMAFNEQRTQIAELNAAMQAEAVNIKSDFPVFNPDSPDYDPEFEKMVSEQYQQAARLQMDENGIVVNADVPLYDFYQQMVNIYSRGATKGQTQAQADAQAMLARTENPGGSSSTSKGGDSLAELEERLGDVVIT